MTDTDKVLEEVPPNDHDDDDLDDDNMSTGPDFLWFQRPAPTPRTTFLVAAVFLVLAFFYYLRRVAAMKRKFGSDFKGALRFGSMISAYVDNDDPTFAVARVVTKSLFFVGFLQLDYHAGFVAVLGLLVLESSLDTIRILLAYWNCKSLEDVRATSADEAQDIAASTQLEPTNVYEDLSRPRTIAVMVFLVQTMLIGIVVYDTYSTPTRTCFNGVATDVCPMLTSLGSYCLYFMGTFMACVFYVGPMNSYGKKEHDPVYWLKLFLMSKQSSSVVSWKDPNSTNVIKQMHLCQNDWRIWMRFVMSFIVNSVCFHFLLHILPVQIASKSSIMGVVFSSVGMIYLVDLDDTSGTVMTLVPHSHNNIHGNGNTDNDINGNKATNSYQNGDHATDLEAAKQKIIDQAMKDTKLKLEALLSGHHHPTSSPTTSHTKPVHLKDITEALFWSAQTKKEEEQQQKGIRNDEETPLV